MMKVGTCGKHITHVPTFLLYNMLTTQEVFDKVAVHLLTQNSKSVEIVSHSFNESDLASPLTVNCRYRGEEGKSCAVGCLIPDDRYDTSIEGGSVESWRVQEILYAMDLQDHVKILSKLQYIHDATEVGDWKNKLKKMAEEYSINSDCLNNFAQRL